MILEGAELAGLAELESDLKKYGSFIIMRFCRYSSFIGSSPSSITKSFWVWSKKYQNPQRNCNFFFGSDSTSANPANSAPSKNWADDWHDEPHNLTIYIFSKYLIGTGQSYRIFHKSLNYDTTLHCCCVVLSPSICIQLQLSRVVTQYCLTSIGSANPPKNWGSQISQVESHKCW